MKRSEIPRLPDAELAVMQALWDCPVPADRTMLASRLSKSRPMAPTTLLTLLSRLAERGCIEIEKRGRQSVYTPKLSRHDYLAARSGSFVRQVCAGSLSDFAAALCDSGLTKKELAALRQLLEDAEA